MFDFEFELGAMDFYKIVYEKLKENNPETEVIIINENKKSSIKQDLFEDAEYVDFEEI